MAFLLGCEKVRVEFPTKTVFEGLSLGVDEGARIGIVGQNGAFSGEMAWKSRNIGKTAPTAAKKE